MTDPTAARPARPAPRRHAAPAAPRCAGVAPVDAAARRARTTPDDLGPDGLAPREAALIEGAVTAVGRGGRGPVVVTVLVVGGVPARAVPAVGPARHAGRRSRPRRRPGSRGVARRRAPSTASRPGRRRGPRRPCRGPAITCALPSQWRSSTIEDWTGRQARVWKAVEVVERDRPGRPVDPVRADRLADGHGDRLVRARRSARIGRPRTSPRACTGSATGRRDGDPVRPARAGRARRRWASCGCPGR